jgi:hypothetical protein
MKLRRIGLMVAAGGVLLTSACGGGGNGNAASSGKPSGGADPMAAFRSCMEKQGVKLPDRGGRGGPGPSGRPSGRLSGPPSGAPRTRPSMSAAQQKAMKACSSLAPQRGRWGQEDQGR